MLFNFFERFKVSQEIILAGSIEDLTAEHVWFSIIF